MTDDNYIEMDRDQILKLQYELSRILADVVDPLTGLRLALDRLATLPSLDGVWAWFGNEQTGDFHLKESAGAGDLMTLHLDTLALESPVARRLIAREEVLGTWEAVWPDQVHTINELGWADVALLPVISQGQVVGALGCGSKSTACMGDSYLWLLRSLAHATGSLVESVRSETRHRLAGVNLTRMLDSFTDPMFIVGTDGTVLSHNTAAVSATSVIASELKGMNVERILPGFESMQREVRSTGSQAEPPLASELMQTHLLDGKGGSYTVEVRINQGNWDGAPAAIVVCRDIAGRLTMEQKNQRLVTAIKHVAESVVITDAEGRIEYVNPAFSRLTGYEASDAIGRNPRLLKSGKHDDGFYRNMWQVLSSGQTWSGRLTNKNKSGEQYVEQAAISPVRDENGIITHYVAVKRDVTTEIATEERLRVSQKLEAVGTLAGGIAHDFNNILYALLGYVDLALDDVPADHPAHEPLQEVITAGNRASRLVRKMLAFSRRSSGKREAVLISDVVTESLELVRASLPTAISLQTDLNAPDCMITADESQLQQVLMNLCANAQHAMRARGGLLRITVDEVELGAGAAQAIGQITPGTWARIQVTDTGQGIDSVVVERIFEPYFTTRKPDEGTGLGLATVHGIVTGHGGYVSAQSELGVGTEFTIYLPTKTADIPVAAEPTTYPDQEVAGHGRIMVVDDEPIVADVLKRSLIRFGFEVTAFINGVEALEVFRATPDAFDVVVTDQTMPNITGFELAHQMLAIRPDLPLVLTTGYAEKGNQEQARVAGIRYYLPKPLKMKELGAVLMELTAKAEVS